MSEEQQKPSTFNLLKLIQGGAESYAKGKISGAIGWAVSTGLSQCFGYESADEKKKKAIQQAVKHINQEFDDIETTLSNVASSVNQLNFHLAEDTIAEIISTKSDMLLDRYTNIDHAVSNMTTIMNGIQDYSDQDAFIAALCKTFDEAYINDIFEELNDIANQFRLNPNHIVSEADPTYLDILTDQYIENLDQRIESQNYSILHEDNPTNLNIFAAQIADIEGMCEKIYAQFWDGYSNMIKGLSLLVALKHTQADTPEIAGNGISHCLNGFVNGLADNETWGESYYDEIIAFDINQEAVIGQMIESYINNVNRLILSCYRPDQNGENIAFLQSEQLNNIMSITILRAWNAGNLNAAHPGLNLYRWSRKSLLDGNNGLSFQPSGFAASSGTNIPSPILYNGQGTSKKMDYWYKVIDYQTNTQISSFADSDIQMLRYQWDWSTTLPAPNSSINLSDFSPNQAISSYYNGQTLIPLDSSQTPSQDDICYAFLCDASDITSDRFFSSGTEYPQINDQTGWSNTPEDVYVDGNDNSHPNGTEYLNNKKGSNIWQQGITWDHTDGIQTSPYSTYNSVEQLYLFQDNNSMEYNSYLSRKIHYLGEDTVDSGSKNCVFISDTRYDVHCTQFGFATPKAKLHAQILFGKDNLQSDTQLIYSLKYKADDKKIDKTDVVVDFLDNDNTAKDSDYISNQGQDSPVYAQLKPMADQWFSWSPQIEIYSDSNAASTKTLHSHMNMKIHYARIAWVQPKLNY